MTATTPAATIATFLTNMRDKALANETAARETLAAYLTSGDQLAFATGMERVFATQADAAPWHYATQATEYYDGDIIKGVRAACEDAMNKLLNLGHGGGSTSGMANLENAANIQGLSVFVRTVQPLLDAVK